MSDLPHPATILPQILQRVAILHAQGKFEDALRTVAENMGGHGHSPDLLHLAAECSMKLKMHAQAAQCWQRAIELRPNFAQAHFSLANLYRETGRFTDAERHYLRVLAIDMQYPNLYSHLGFVLKAQKRLTEAEEFLRRGMVLQPDHFTASNLGRLYAEIGRLDDAENYFRHALAQEPTFAGAYFNLGLLYRQRGKQAEAEANLRRAIQLQPDMLEAHMALGNFYAEEQRFEEAELCYQKAGELKPNAPEIFGNLGALYATRGRHELAEAAYRRMLATGVPYAGGHFNFANLLTDLGRYNEAEAQYRTALELTPADATTWFNYGNMLRSATRHDEAIAAYRRALEIDPQNADIHNGLGMVFYEANRFEEAENAYRRALQLDPKSFKAYLNLGILYKMRNEFAAAEDYYRRALAIEPKDPVGIYCLALLKLTQADFETGWKLYEARYDDGLGTPIAAKPILPFPQWRGENLSGRSIALFHEQGFGDVIHFARYVSILKRQGATVTLVVKQPLQELMRTLEGVDRVLCFSELPALGRHDYWSLLLSVPLHCQTRLETIPATVNYFSVPQDHRRKWQHQVTGNGIKAGLVWKGSSAYSHDSERSLASLAALAPLWDVPGVTFVSLQKGRGESEVAQPPPGRPILDLGSKMENFADAAAIVEQLDLIICVDTAIAHLAGALGKPVFLLVPFTPDWRWMLDREDSPWYPTVRLFRQQKRSDWRPVIERVASALRLYVQRGGQ